jgi:hypothetical protein
MKSKSKTQISFLFRKNRVDDAFMKVVIPASLLVPRDQGRLDHSFA